MCFVNSQNVRDLRQPFGGTKASGTGREGGTWSYEVFCEPKNIAVSLGSTTFRIGESDHGKARSRRQDHARAVDVPVGACRARTRAAAGRDRRPHGDRPALPRARRGHHRGVRRALAGQRRTTTSTARRSFKGIYTSNELPHFISNMPYAFPGNPALGQPDRGRRQRAWAWRRCAHDATTLEPEYGTLVPMRYMNSDQHFKVVSVVRAGAMALPERQRALRLGDAARDRGALRRHRRGVRQRLAVAPLRAERPRPSSCSRSGALPRAARPAAWSSCGSRATGRPSAACCPSTPTSAMAKASCTTPRCCSALLGWEHTRAGGSRHAVFRQFGHRADQRDLSRDADDDEEKSHCPIASVDTRQPRAVDTEYRRAVPRAADATQVLTRQRASRCFRPAARACSRIRRRTTRWRTARATTRSCYINVRMAPAAATP